MVNRILCLCLLLGLALSAFAGGEEMGYGLSASGEKKLAKGLKLEAEAEVRSQEGFSQLERWAMDLSLNYKIATGWKADLGYCLMDRYHLGETTGKGNLLSGYWAPRHRWYVSLVEQLETGRWKFSLRERYQLTHSPLQYVPKYTPEGVRMTDEVKAGDQEHIMRCRLQAAYNIRHCKFDPTCSIEALYDLKNGGVDQLRYSVGVDYSLSKQTTWSLDLRYKDRDDSDESNGWLLTVGYHYSF